ncbi:hypothetical protein AO385_1577 [Moraxella catarrhalis]|uniref:Uncharacterized protein n=1 Tax=Moraxella catarrhalis TaxID=480 RepID=A0A198UCK2_MORCA|nr:hypothetical protein AO384_2207 [Moraxella catarrhalis]OAU98651.1 hypothetical protein AO385_1577 [Moraxella catarrhalis]OAU99658.1 hypothetical protein AO383_0115 [Moraxella catarrhalis]
MFTAQRLYGKVAAFRRVIGYQSFESNIFNFRSLMLSSKPINITIHH